MKLFRLRVPPRSAETELFDTFFVSAVASVLLIRVALEATGYPRLGSEGFHIAHVLWGGLGMLVAIVLLLGFLDTGTRHAAALLGGIGFGAFIDELGKFLTADNDYFFQPTAALIYVLFVLLFFTVRQIRHYRGLSPAEDLANALQIAEQLPDGSITAAQRERALALLDGADQSDPLVSVLRQRFRDAATRAARLTRAARFEHAVTQRYATIAGSRWFARTIIALFALEGFGFVLGVVAAVAVLIGTAAGIPDARAALDELLAGSTLTSWIQMIAGALAGVTLVRGMIALRSSRAHAYRLFEIAVLVDLLLVQPFQFLDNGFTQSVDVVFDLVLFAVLRYLHSLEQSVRLRTLAGDEAIGLAAVARGS